MGRWRLQASSRNSSSHDANLGDSRRHRGSPRASAWRRPRSRPKPCAATSARCVRVEPDTVEEMRREAEAHGSIRGQPIHRERHAQFRHASGRRAGSRRGARTSRVVTRFSRDVSKRAWHVLRVDRIRAAWWPDSRTSRGPSGSAAWPWRRTGARKRRRTGRREWTRRNCPMSRSTQGSGRST